MGFSIRRGALLPADDKRVRSHGVSTVTSTAVALMLTGAMAGSLTGAQAYQASARGTDAISVPVNKAVDLDLANADLGLVVDAIQRQTGANIVIQAGQKPFGRVNVHLNNMPLDKALRNVALSAGATLIKDSDGTFILRQGGQGMQDSSDDRTPAITRRAVSQDDLHWYKIVLQHAVPHDVLYLMHWDAGVRSISPFNSANVPDNNFPNRPAIVLMSGDPVAPSVPGGNGTRGAAQANRFDTMRGESHYILARAYAEGAKTDTGLVPKVLEELRQVASLKPEILANSFEVDRYFTALRDRLRPQLGIRR